MEIVRIKLSALEPNTGQIPGLPMNPRQWTATDVDRIANSLQETPELFEARPLLVYPINAQEANEAKRKYIILGGNLRYEGAKRNKMKEVPCIIFPWPTEFNTLKAVTIKDNGSFGAWDYDTLANEWGDLPLTDWGVPAWNEEAVDESAVDALFEQQEGGAPDKPILIQVALPVEYQDKEEDIRAALKVTLEEWPGCLVK